MSLEKIKMSQGTLMTLEQAISMLEGGDFNIPFKVWYGLNKTRKGIDSNMKVLNESRVELLKKYVEADESGNFKSEQKGDAWVYKFKDDKSREEYNKEMNPILEEEVEVEIYKIDINCFEEVSTSLQKQPLLGFLLEYIIK